VDRFYVLAEDADPARPPDVDPVDARLLACLPRTAHELSDVGHSLGLCCKDLGRRKQALGIETYKRDGRWFCRHVEGHGAVLPRQCDGRQAPSTEANRATVTVEHTGSGFLPGTLVDLYHATQEARQAAREAPTAVPIALAVAAETTAVTFTGIPAAVALLAYGSRVDGRAGWISTRATPVARRVSDCRIGERAAPADI
jgi:hypothetical protein